MLYLKNNTRQKTPKIDFDIIHANILGVDYDLSVVIASSALSRKLNKQYRQKDKSTNVLSFPLSKQTGEIFLDIGLIKKEAREKKKKFIEYFSYIFIHGVLHLKGLDHGSKMEKEEDLMLKKLYPDHSLFD